MSDSSSDASDVGMSSIINSDLKKNEENVLGGRIKPSVEKQSNVDFGSWVGSTETNINACSLEVLRNFDVDAYGMKESITDSETTRGGHDMSYSRSNSVQPLIIGCYQLNDYENESRRDGELLLYNVEGVENCYNSSCAKKNCNILTEEKRNNSGFVLADTFESESGILDLKWIQSCTLRIFNENNDDNRRRRHVFASACASGKIWLYSLEQEKEIDPVNEKEHPKNISSKSTQRFFVKQLVSSLPMKDSGLALSLDCNESNLDSNRGVGRVKIVSSYSNGSIGIHDATFLAAPYSMNSNGSEVAELECNNEDDVKINVTEAKSWDAHSLFNGRVPAEVWTCCWAKMNTARDENNKPVIDDTNLLLSGGDDCILKGWDLRMNLPVFKIGNEEHQAGVTALSWHPSEEYLFASGSYDEGVRVWDVRQMTSICNLKSYTWNATKCPRKLASIQSCGGGIWRLKWHPKDPCRLLVAAMHGGCRVLDVRALQQVKKDDCENDVYPIGSMDSSATVVASFTAHESMAYGADWLHNTMGQQMKNTEFSSEAFDDSALTDLAASCSFYDRKAFIWQTTQNR